jgi:hypothetical protein
MSIGHSFDFIPAANRSDDSGRNTASAKSSTFVKTSRTDAPEAVACCWASMTASSVSAGIVAVA